MADMEAATDTRVIEAFTQSMVIITVILESQDVYAPTHQNAGLVQQAGAAVVEVIMAANTAAEDEHIQNNTT